ncbi:MAG: carboxylating nicotinate-nucleotide diphosphorylase [Chloroflexi bacterium]|nr:carboxylating nicotinate-nucleotide diphosphorylase [Chloroflexota bacterium]
MSGSNHERFALDERLALVSRSLPEDLQQAAVLKLFQLSLEEDLLPPSDTVRGEGRLTEGDITSTATIEPDCVLEGRITAKACGVVAGLPAAGAIFTLVDPTITFEARIPDGAAVEAGELLATVVGSGVSLLAAERAALNFLGRMSGVSTLTRKYVEAVAGTKAVILDTRKTAPGWRALDKYAVRMGGGRNHRLGLYDMALIKDNHIDGAGSISAAVKRVRGKFGNCYPIEVEVKDLAELEEALALLPDRIMLDNMSLETMRRAVEVSGGRAPLEASGNVSLETVRAIAETGVDFISVGALTHSATALDVSMRLK